MRLSILLAAYPSITSDIGTLYPVLLKTSALSPIETFVGTFQRLANCNWISIHGPGVEIPQNI